jgi:hypothetical protein
VFDKVLLVNSVPTVPPSVGSSKHRRASSSVRVLGDDGFREFARVAVQGRSARIFVVSPWVSTPSSHRELALISDHLERRRGELIVVTRVAGEGVSQRVAVQDLIDCPWTSVYELNNLHAKMCLAELPGGRLAALVGSANVTNSSQRLREVGLLILTKRCLQLGQDLEEAVHAFKASAVRVDAVELGSHLLDMGVASIAMPSL